MYVILSLNSIDYFLGESKLLRVENPLFMEFCKDVMNNITWIEPPDYLINSVKYSEERHYHSMKLILDEHDRTKDTVLSKPNDSREQKR